MKNNKTLLFLLTILVLLAVWFLINNEKSTINEAYRSFSVSDTAAISKIVLGDKKQTITLEHEANGSWQLNGKSNANIKTIRTLIYTINKIDIKAPVSKNEANKIVKNLIDTAIRCDIYQRGKLKKSYYIGATTADKQGTYMILIDNETNRVFEKPFITYVPGYNSSINTHYSTDVRHWRDKTVFNYNQADIKSIRLEYPSKSEKSFELFLTKNNYHIKMLTNNAIINTIDTIAVKQYITYYFGLNYEYVNEPPSDVSKKQLISSITITDIKGNTNKVVFYSDNFENTAKETMDNDNQIGVSHLYAKLDGGDIVVVQMYLFAKLMQEADYFQKNKFSTK